MKTKEICRTVKVDDALVQVTLGDTIWWFAQDQTTNVPAVAFVTAFQESDMVQLMYLSSVGKPMVIEGVCLMGDPNLSNPNYRKRGCWAPRGPWKALELQD